jgi:hypothetical protein
VLQKKPGVLNSITLDHITSKKITYIYFYCQGYGNAKGLAIIQDFTDHWAIKKKEMANVWTFEIESESSQLECRMFPYDSNIELNWVGSHFL